jgi:predicted MPP superfamily phosphohydrolase
MTAYGYVNAGNISVKRLSINISKGKRPEQKMKILYFSDTHLTPVNNGRIMDQILSCMEEYKPDLILMGGDIVDDHSRQLQRFALDEKLARLTAPLGVYTCPGNHEYISGYEDASKVLAQAGITILRDSMVVINNSLQLIGRDDPSGARFWGKRRKSLEELTRSADKSLPLILLDHQPFNLEKSSAAGINLQLSGHTHHGQMFPANLVTANIYELSRGYLKKDETHFYVSSGAGTWGPPVRTGSRSEVVCIDLQY